MIAERRPGRCFAKGRSRPWRLEEEWCGVLLEIESGGVVRVSAAVHCRVPAPGRPGRPLFLFTVTGDG